MDDIFHDTFYTIGMIPENPEVSLYDTIMQDIMDDSFFLDAQFIYEEGIAPGSDIYIKAHDYLYDSLKDYITEESFHKVVSHRILLLLNPHNETAFSPLYDHFEVIDVQADTFTVQHSAAFEDENTLFESEFLLEDGTFE